MTYFLKRHIGYYLIQVYFPDIFVVALSWIVFWMDKNDMGNRMAIGITTILTITFLLGSLNGFMPRVSYPKALDWYLLVSFTLTFLLLVECMIVFVVSMSENKEHDDQVCLIVFVSLYFLGPVHMYLFLSENRDFLSLSKKKTVHTLCFIILFARPHENPIATENGTHLDGNMRIHWQLSL